MESEKQIYKNDIENKNSFTLPKNYIDQNKVVIKKNNHKRSNSISDNLYGANDFDQDLENNSFRFKTERTKKRVSFNQRIQIINIHNYKYENKILYYENQIPDDDKQDIPKPSKCLSCLVF